MWLGRAKLEPQLFFNVSGKFCGTILGRFWEAEMRSRRRRTAQNGAKTAQDGARRPKMVLRRPKMAPSGCCKRPKKGDRRIDYEDAQTVDGRATVIVLNCFIMFFALQKIPNCVSVVGRAQRASERASERSERSERSDVDDPE